MKKHWYNCWLFHSYGPWKDAEATFMRFGKKSEQLVQVRFCIFCNKLQWRYL